MRGHRQHKLDANHTEITEALRQCGFSVQSLALVGAGCPDVLVGYCGVNVALELKDGTAAPSRQKLTADEQKFRDGWKGQVSVANSAEEAIRIVYDCVRARGNLAARAALGGK